MNRALVQRLGFAFLGLITFVVVVPILLVIGVIVARGIVAINWQFLTTMPHGGMKEGGILPAIVVRRAGQVAGTGLRGTTSVWRAR